mgnify:CR=1 FL=1
MKAQDFMNQFEEYSSSSEGADFFHLADDGDEAWVRFLYADIEDFSENGWQVVHEIEIDGKTRKVACLTPEGKECPLCQAGNKSRPKGFIQLIDYSDGKKLKVWERGRQFVGKFVTYLEEYNPLFQQYIKIKRSGKKGDTNTTYNPFPMSEAKAKEEGVFMEDTEENREKIKEKRADLAGEEKANLIIKRDKADLEKMVAGTFKFDQTASSSSGSNQKSKKSDNPADFF